MKQQRLQHIHVQTADTVTQYSVKVLQDITSTVLTHTMQQMTDISRLVQTKVVQLRVSTILRVDGHLVNGHMKTKKQVSIQLLVYVATAKNRTAQAVQQHVQLSQYVQSAIRHTAKRLLTKSQVQKVSTKS